jgi:hypothetical protein
MSLEITPKSKEVTPKSKEVTPKSIEITPKYLTEQETAIYTSIAVQTLRNNRYERKGLPFFKLGKSVRYAVEDIERYMKKNRVELIRESQNDSQN